MGRVPIGGTDFSTRPYTYDDDVGDFGGADANLTKFALQSEDFKFKVNICLLFFSRSFSLFVLSCFSFYLDFFCIFPPITNNGRHSFVKTPLTMAIL